MRIAAALGAIMLAGVASAHDPQRADLNDWYSGLRSPRGVCCGDNDRVRVKEADWESVNDPAKPDVHYRVKIEGEWIDVPDAAVLKEPNRAGITLVWISRQSAYGGPVKINVTCFMPGPMG